MPGLKLPRLPRWLALVVAAMAGVLALDYLRGYVTGDHSRARLVAFGFWTLNAVIWTVVYALGRGKDEGSR